MSRPNSYKREFLTDHEVMNRAAPGGRMPIASAKNATGRGGDWTQIADGSPAAAQAAAERHEAKHRPNLVTRRQREGR
jgi:hypothetical protein